MIHLSYMSQIVTLKPSDVIPSVKGKGLKIAECPQK